MIAGRESRRGKILQRRRAVLARLKGAPHHECRPLRLAGRRDTGSKDHWLRAIYCQSDQRSQHTC